MKKELKWYITTEKNQPVIRGWPGNKRRPLRDYAAFRHNEEELKAYVLRLNAPHALRTKVAFQHAYIDDALLKEYLQFLKTQIPAEKGALQEFSYLKRYALNYFIGDLGLINPSDWYAVSETKWAAHLLSLKGKRGTMSVKTRRDIVNALNRFVKYLHKRRPKEAAQVEFEPITKAKYAEIAGKRELNGEVLARHYIPEEDLKKICEKAPKKIHALICLAAYYGLRRAEPLGLKLSDVKKGYLSVERQLGNLNELKPLKGKLKRRTPHWFATAAQAYLWVEEASKYPMHPCTLGDRWDELMGEFEPRLPYKLHDLRHTWITNAVRKHAARDVQLAVGHKDLRTTMAYLKDDRTLDDEEWEPTG